MLLVGSVYRDDKRNKHWYNLQIEYLKKTTQNYSHAIYLNGSDNIYNDSIVVKKDTSKAKQNEYHHRGLNAIIHYFNENTQYKNLLLLDNDCFPIKENWQTELQTHMKNYDVAAVSRYENLDNFAHPSAFFVKRSNTSTNLSFAILPQINLLEQRISDTSCHVKSFFPLIRSNKTNLHPILCGIYWNTFYHHGAGSRKPEFRIFTSYYKDRKDIIEYENYLFNELVKNPKKFIETLCTSKKNTIDTKFFM